MPSRAFVPMPLTEAEPRVYKSFRGRELKGILMGMAGAGLILILVGIRDFAGYALAFFAALPGFAYGYYRPSGKPVEYWLGVLFRFYTTPQVITSQREAALPHWRLWLAQIPPIVTRRPRKVRKERNARG